MLEMTKRLLIGRRLHNLEIEQEKMPKWKALAIFSSDALSSVAYGPEQIVLMLVAVPGILAYGYLGYISLAILALLAIVTISYVQVAKANPGGGGSYSVAKHNLGELPALTAAASLFTDYVLTVAVSVSAGTAALISAFPAFIPYEVSMDLFVLFVILMLVNLRGVRESSTAFVFPTYAFIFGIFALLGAGIYQVATQGAPAIPMESMERQWNWAVFAMILRAFANGCSSMTGVEAISNGVPMFREPAVRNASATTYSMSAILGVMFLGIAGLVMHYHILPMEDVTALSQIAELTFGRGFIYYYIQVTTMLVLYLAANTSYNGLPPLLSILAKDGYMPRYLGERGERLNFSNGIILLTVLAAILIVMYQGNTEHLISLYAIGVFMSFTIAQTGMVVYWRREKGKQWLLRAGINAIGAVVTGMVVLIIAVSKFFYGAWIVLVFVPAMIYVFKQIRAHYNDMADQLHLPLEYLNPQEEHSFHMGRNIVIVPVASPTVVVMETLKYAKHIGDDVTAVHVSTDEESRKRVEEKWQSWNPGVPLVNIDSPYRLLMQPLFDYISMLERQRQPEDYITVLIPEFETKKLWHRFLHNQTGWILRTMLLLKKNVIVTTIPFHLRK